jgi:hypothetical protein
MWKPVAVGCDQKMAEVEVRRCACDRRRVVGVVVSDSWPLGVVGVLAAVVAGCRWWIGRVRLKASGRGTGRCADVEAS